MSLSPKRRSNPVRAALGVAIAGTLAASVTVPSALASPPAFAPLPFQLQRLSDMCFGSFASAFAGTLVLTPEGVRRGTGGVMPLSWTPSTAGAFRVVVPGDRSDAPCRFTMPNAITLRNTSPGGGTMVADTFTLQVSPARPHGAGKFARLVKVGATLHIGDRQPPGLYAGTLTTIMDYD
jgi:hypothetical protein